MRHFRALLYFTAGFLFATWAVFAHAATQAATPGWVWIGNPTGYPDADSACRGGMAKAFPTYVYSHRINNACYGTSPGAYGPANWGDVAQSGYNCPMGWLTSGATCSCDSPRVVDPATGFCEMPADPCQSKAGTYKGSGYVAVPSGSPIPSGTHCDGTCEVNSVLSIGGAEMLVAKGKDYWPIGQTYTGNKCTASNNVPELATPDKAPATPPKTPPCASGEGVMTSSSGSVKCVPEGVPDAAKPVVKKEKKVETYPDGTTKASETTTTKDPNTGATHSSTSSTATGKADGTAGQAGSVGTTTSTGGTSTGTGGGSGTGDGDCSGNDCGADHAFPETGELWKKKYPNGISGVLNEKFTAIKASSLGGLVGQLAPNLPNSGACPSWSFAMNIGQHMNFGGATLNMPCAVWSFVRIVLLITAALVARRLIFGG